MWQQFQYASLITKYFPLNSKPRPEKNMSKLYPNIIYFGLALRYQIILLENDKWCGLFPNRRERRDFIWASF